MAEEGRRHRQIRRRHRRDRDRQSHHGGGGGRRRHARQDPGAGRHRRRRGQYADRHDPRRRRGRALDAQATAEAAPKRRRCPAKRRSSRRARSRLQRPKPPHRRRTSACGRGVIARSGSAGRHRDGHHDDARGAARRHGRRDAPRPGRLRDGRRGRRISGRLQSHPGPAARIRRAARHRYADHRAWLCRRRRRRGVRRIEADRRIHDLQFRHAGDGSAHQFGGEDALHVGRAGEGLDRVSRPERRRPRASPRSTARIIRPGIRTFPA